MAKLPPSDAFLNTEQIVGALNLAPGMHAADLGCGSGYFTVAMARAVGKNGIVAGVDVRQEPLDELHAKVNAMGLGNVQEVRADLEVLGGTALGDNTQDLSLLANTLFKSKKKDLMLKEAARMTKPGGRVIVIEWKKGAGGFGPPDDLRTTEDEMKHIAEAQGLKFSDAFPAGRLYYGQIFMKP